MLKKWLIGTALIALVGLLAAYANRESLMFAVIKYQIAPEHDYDPALLPRAPDYSQSEAWAALPEKEDPADDRPEGVVADLDVSAVGVFFVHPTSYFGKDNWNQPLDATDANWIVDHRVLRHQASVFNSAGEVFAPRYRQATFYSFLDQTGSGEQALAQAYEDVESAFDEFLKRNGERPFILSGHSQGTRHSTQLLRERIAGTPLQDRLVAAYLVGFSIEKEQLGGVPRCQRANQTGCAMGWNTVEGENTGLYPTATELICTNPLSWLENNEYAGHELNTGAIGYPEYAVAGEGEDYTAMKTEPGAADSRCHSGMLTVLDLRSASFPSRMPGNSMHVYDYSLFYSNIRDNAQLRVQAYLATH